MHKKQLLAHTQEFDLIIGADKFITSQIIFF